MKCVLLRSMYIGYCDNKFVLHLSSTLNIWEFLIFALEK